MGAELSEVPQLPTFADWVKEHRLPETFRKLPMEFEGFNWDRRPECSLLRDLKKTGSGRWLIEGFREGGSLNSLHSEPHIELYVDLERWMKFLEEKGVGNLSTCLGYEDFPNPEMVAQGVGRIELAECCFSLRGDGIRIERQLGIDGDIRKTLSGLFIPPGKGILEARALYTGDDSLWRDPVVFGGGVEATETDIVLERKPLEKFLIVIPE
ncbi:MAG: hypothetical protein UT36_C0005G0057 [Candidatus Peregrinibacteria bacterium GW2011_GWF2_39_17]|nr:MAG: hypothetical protein UT36_C0005G0057 [Candidatus Peregrinibacteria bacterium GW2011_GWF2_39_17]HCW32893.1 hypothetical protein [Candidatus Peregrinibacteria bacterium]